MDSNSNLQCHKCRGKVKVTKSGLGHFHLDCNCGIVNQGLTLEKAAEYLELDAGLVKRHAVDLMVTDVPV